MLKKFRVASTMVAHSSSVPVIAHSNPSQVSPLLVHIGKGLAVTLPVKRSAGVVPEVDLRGIYITFASTKSEIRQNPLPSFETQRRRHQESKTGGTSSPKIGYEYVSAKNIKRKIPYKHEDP